MRKGEDQIKRFGNALVTIVREPRDEVKVQCDRRFFTQFFHIFKYFLGIVPSAYLAKGGGVCRLHADLKAKKSLRCARKNVYRFVVKKRCADLEMAGGKFCLRAFRKVDYIRKDLLCTPFVKIKGSTSFARTLSPFSFTEERQYEQEYGQPRELS